MDDFTFFLFFSSPLFFTFYAQSVHVQGNDWTFFYLLFSFSPATLAVVNFTLRYDDDYDDDVE